MPRLRSRSERRGLSLAPTTDDSGGWLSAGQQRFDGWIVRERTELGIITAEWYLGFGAPLGRPKERITDREAILDAVIETQEFVYLDSWEEWLEIRKTLQPPSWKEHRREHVGRAIALGEVNVAETARIYGVSRSRPYEWAQRPSVLAWVDKTGQNLPIGREVDSMPLTKADMNELREELEDRYEALHADVRATLAVVLERFPDSKAVAAAVEEFLDRTLRD